MTRRILVTASLVLATLIVPLLLPTFAHAGPAEERKAQQLFEEGTNAYRTGDYEQAVRSFEEASRLSRDPVYLYNLGQALRRTGRARDAIKAYQGYLTAAPSAPNRAAVQKLIAELRTQVEPERPVVPAPVVTPEKPDLTPAPPPKEVSSPGRPTLYWVGWGLVATGVALVAAGIGLEVSAKGISDDLSTKTNPPTVWSDKVAADRASQESSGRLRANVGYALLGIGGAAAATGVVVVIWKSGSRAERATVSPSAGGMVMNFKF